MSVTVADRRHPARRNREVTSTSSNADKQGCRSEPVNMAPTRWPNGGQFRRGSVGDWSTATGPLGATGARCVIMPAATEPSAGGRSTVRTRKILGRKNPDARMRQPQSPGHSAPSAQISGQQIGRMNAESGTAALRHDQAQVNGRHGRRRRAGSETEAT